MTDTLLVTALIAISCTAALLFARSLLFRLLHRWAGRTDTKLDDIMIDSMRTPSLLWCVAFGGYVSIGFSELSEKNSAIAFKIITVVVMISVTAAVATLMGRIFRQYLDSSGLPLSSTGLMYGVIQGTVYIMGALVTLGYLGVSIAPILTTLGVGGLAVALALQDTLSNLFSGIHILLERSIRVGDFIRLETGQEGYVMDITWRTTRVRMLPNNIVVIPNGKLAQSIVTNYSLPEKQMSLRMSIGVSYSCDPENVERIITEEAKGAVGKVDGLLGEPEPFVRFVPGFGESSLDFTLTCQVREFVDQYNVQHELSKRILNRFRAEGIEIPFPQRTVHIRKDETPI